MGTVRSPAEIRASRERRVRELRLLAVADDAAGYPHAAAYRRGHAARLQALIDKEAS